MPAGGCAQDGGGSRGIVILQMFPVCIEWMDEKSGVMVSSILSRRKGRPTVQTTSGSQVPGAKLRGLIGSVITLKCQNQLRYKRRSHINMLFDLLEAVLLSGNLPIRWVRQ